MRGTLSRITGIIIITLAMLSCNLSTAAAPAPTPTDASTPTPEDTATQALPPTFPPPIALPSATSIPPTETSTEIPTSTNTPSPTGESATETATSTILPFDPNSTPTPPPTIPSGYNSATPHPYYTKTFTPPPVINRSPSSVTAIQFTPMMDGDWGDWPNAETTSGYVVFGLPKWKNSNDLNSSFKAAYDGNYLYVAVKVLDDVYSQNSTGNSLYLGDSVEILMDTNLDGDYYSKSLSSDDFQIGISAGKKTIDGPKEAYLWYPTTIRGTITQVLVASRYIEGGYELEAAIPWSVFGVTPYSGSHYGFALSVSDNDNSAKAAQDSMVSSASERRLLNPTTWGDLILQ